METGYPCMDSLLRRYGPFSRVHSQQMVSIHTPDGAAIIALPPELNDSDCLVHPGSQSGIHRCRKDFHPDPGHKTLARIISYPRRKHGKWAQIDARSHPPAHQKAVVAYSIRSTLQIQARLCPQQPPSRNIVRFPHRISNIMEAHHSLHNDIRPGALVKNIPNNMEIINGKILISRQSAAINLSRNN